MQAIPYNTIFGPSHSNASGQVFCPVCGDEWVHLEDVADGEGYESGREGDAGKVLNNFPWVRGPVKALIFAGDCGHRFSVSLGFHKGATFVFCERLSDVINVDS
jgi:hypothetical protein